VSGFLRAAAVPEREVLFPIGDLHGGPARSQTAARWLSYGLTRRFPVSAVAWT